MARDWKTTYAAAADAASHTVTFPQAAVAGHRLVAFAAAPASISPTGWIEHVSPASELSMSAASKTATGGETSLTWDRDAGQSTAPRTLAGWVESRNDLGALEAAPSVVASSGSTGSVAITVEVPVADCRVYVAICGKNPTSDWLPTWPSPLATEDGITAVSPTTEDVRLAVASGVFPAGSHDITIGGLPQSAEHAVAALVYSPTGGPPPPTAETPVEAENRLGGTAQSTWDVVGAGDASIQGFATAMSVARGGTLALKVHSPSSPWTGRVYRLGYYGGLGAREVAMISGPQTTQPSGTVDPTTGTASCANWSANGSWGVPADAPAGVYVIKIARTDSPALASHVGPFVVTDPLRKAAIAVKLSDSTWQAYNHAGADPSLPFSGKSLYGVGTAAAWSWDTGQRARAVSYDRPLVTRRHLPQTHFFNAEYPLVRWLERLGYDVDYLTCAQVDADPSLLLGRKAVISSGHDEYWSQGMRDAFVAARDHASTPSHLAFLSGNEAFWRINWASDRRSYACWKDSHDGVLNASGVYSGTWQDTRSFNPDRRPAALLTGQRFRLNGISAYPLEVPEALRGLPIWRNVSDWTFPTGIVGFEADEPADLNPVETPAGLIRLSLTTRTVTGMLSDVNGATYTGTGQYTHAITAYRSPITGAAVFGFGTVQYAWGLDDVHDRHPGGVLASQGLQQALTNLLADLGATPPAYPVPAGLVRPTAVALSTYGLPNPTPGPDPDPEDPLYGYATVGQLTEHLGRTPVNAAQLLRRASRDVDRALLCAVYDPTDPDVVSVLREATLEQIAANLDHGNVTGNGGSRRGGFTIGRLTVQAGSSDDAPVRIGSLWEQAWDILQSAGLTGHGPQSR